MEGNRLCNKENGHKIYEQKHDATISQRNCNTFKNPSSKSCTSSWSLRDQIRTLHHNGILRRRKPLLIIASESLNSNLNEAENQNYKGY